MAEKLIQGVDLTPEEIKLATRGGGQAEAAYAEAEVSGQIPSGTLKLIIGVDENGNLVYKQPPDEDLGRPIARKGPRRRRR